MSILDGSLNCLDCFRPEGTGSLTLAFATDAHIVGAVEPDMVDIEIDDFLSPRPGVIENSH